MSQKKRLTLFVALSCFFAFFLFGFTDNMKGPTIPLLLVDLHYNYSMGGTILLGAYLGFFAATLFVGMVSDAIGKKGVIYLAGIFLIIGIMAYIYSTGYIPLIISMFCIGIAMGSFELGCNYIIIDLYENNKGKHLNMLSFFHGLGSMAAPLYAGQLLSMGYSWRNVYGFSLPLAIILLLGLSMLKYPAAKTKKNENKIMDINKTALTADMLLLYLLIFFYVAAELGIGSWLVEFLQKSKNQSAELSSMMLSLFFGSMTLGRFLGYFLVERIGYLRILIYVIILSILCLSIGIFGPVSFSFLLPSSGLFLSIVFPTSTAMVSKIHQDKMGIILGLFFSVAGLGGMVGPWAIGITSDRWGIQIGLSIAVLFCVCSLIALFALTRVKTKATV